MSAEEVYRKSWSRFNILEQAPLHQLFQESIVARFLGRTVYAKMPLAFHHFIYEGLFTFAGQYRSAHDPHGGRIYFGHQHAQRRKPRFQEDPTDTIEAGVLEAAWHLKRRTDDALGNAIRFYQKFVNVHPFYDANGRIGRLIATMYLTQHNLVLSWSEFDSKKKFIKKLNRCHVKPDEENFTYLVDYLRAFTIPLEDLES